MSFSLKQELRQSQQLVMTQQLQQSIKLLQLSAIELAEFIDLEIEKNPLLSRDDTVSDGESASEEYADKEWQETEGSSESSHDEATASQEADSSEWDSVATEFEPQSIYDDEFNADYADASEGAYSRVTAGSGESLGTGGFTEDEEGNSLEQTYAKDRSLREHLLEQLHVDMVDPTMRLIGTQLIDLLDESGYLRESTESIATILGAECEMIEQTIEVMQRFDPLGVFARSLSECLRIQLEDKGRLDEPMEKFLNNMHLLAEGNVAALRKVCGVDDEELQLIIADVRLCNPRPASQFVHDIAEAITPDVLIRKSRQGWLIDLNPEALPRVIANQNYFTEMSQKLHDKEAKKYLTEQWQNASWLVKALDQRAQTMLKVSREIVKQQEKFFLHGIRFLKPLVLKDIAEAIEMHESTVSRVTTSKFMSTPRGTFEMKYFFNSTIGGSMGDAEFSSKTVMYYIKELIESESPKDILSDDAIVTLLKDRNIDVARRTITKYREAMNIPSSVVRRRQKNAVGS